MHKGDSKSLVWRTDVEQHDAGLAPGGGHAEPEGVEAVHEVRRRRQQRARRRVQRDQDVARVQICGQIPTSACTQMPNHAADLLTTLSRQHAYKSQPSCRLAYNPEPPVSSSSLG